MKTWDIFTTSAAVHGHFGTWRIQPPSGSSPERCVFTSMSSHVLQTSHPTRVYLARPSHTIHSSRGAATPYLTADRSPQHELPPSAMCRRERDERVRERETRDGRQIGKCTRYFSEKKWSNDVEMGAFWYRISGAQECVKVKKVIYGKHVKMLLVCSSLAFFHRRSPRFVQKWPMLEKKGPCCLYSKSGPFCNGALPSLFPILTSFSFVPLRDCANTYCTVPLHHYSGSVQYRTGVESYISSQNS